MSRGDQILAFGDDICFCVVRIVHGEVFSVYRDLVTLCRLRRDEFGFYKTDKLDGGLFYAAFRVVIGIRLGHVYLNRVFTRNAAVVCHVERNGIRSVAVIRYVIIIVRKARIRQARAERVRHDRAVIESVRLIGAHYLFVIPRFRITVADVDALLIYDIAVVLVIDFTVF